MSKVRELIEESAMTTSEIAEYMGMNYPEIKRLSGMTDSELSTRDTQIEIYDVLGYDGSSKTDMCFRCGIIMIHDLRYRPGNWVKDQKSHGNICQYCLGIVLERYRPQHEFLESCQCHLCSGDSSVYYYQRGILGTNEIYPWRAVPLCEKDKEILYESEESACALIRDFHDGLPDDIVRALLGE